MKTRKRLIALTALAVVAVPLIARELPSLRRGDSPRAGRQMKATGFAVERYMQEHQGHLPPMMDRSRLEALLRPYLDNTQRNPVFLGVTLSQPLFARPETGEPYRWNTALSGQSVQRFPHPDQEIVVYESRPNYGGRLVGFLDGHHAWLDESQWLQQKQKAHLP